MSLFNWFTGKSPRSAQGVDSSGLRDSRGRSPESRERSPASPASQRAEPEVKGRGSRKAKRHARRELLYVAIREAMTRAGVLASSYKFKVLSLDQGGDEFLVMMNVAPALGRQPDKLAETEALIAHTAKARFQIFVTSVYWRIDAAVQSMPRKHPTTDPASLAGAIVAPAIAANVAPVKPMPARYEAIQADEVAAFKQALAAASSSPQAAADVTGKARAASSYTLLTGFEDTEMPESVAAPALSTTQYGDLN